MKVKEIVKKYRYGVSNSTIFIQNGIGGDIFELKKNNIIDLDPEYIMLAKVESFEIIDNVLTIYISF